MNQTTQYANLARRSISDLNAELDQAFRVLSEELQKQKHLLDGEQQA